MLDVTRLSMLRELKVQGSLAAVARGRGISASAVSQQLRKLEAEAGTRLLETRGRNLALTAAALRLVVHAEEILSILETAESELSEGRERLHGRVRVSAIATFAMRYLPALLDGMNRDHPDVDLTFTQTEPGEAIDAVTRRRSDVAIVDEFPNIPKRVDSSLSRLFLLRDEMIPCLPAGTDPDRDLSELRWVTEPEGSDACAWAQRVCRELGFEPQIFYQSPDLAVHEELVRSGAAAGFLPKMLLSSYRADFDVPRIRMTGGAGGREPLWRDVYAVTRRSAGTSRAVRVVLGQLRIMMGADAAHG